MPVIPSTNVLMQSQPDVSRVRSGVFRGGEPAPPPLNSSDRPTHVGSPMFERSQQEAFSDAWKTLKSVFGRDSVPDSTGGVFDTPTDPLVGLGGVRGRLHGMVEQFGKRPYHLTIWRPGLRPGPCYGSLQRSPRPLAS